MVARAKGESDSLLSFDQEAGAAWTLNDPSLSDDNLPLISGYEDRDDKKEHTETVSLWYPE